MVEQHRRVLEAQLRRQEVRRAIEKVRNGHEVFKKYPLIEDLLSLGRPGNQNYADKDAVLVILLSEIKQVTTLFPLLNLMFWESLVRLFYSKRKKVPDSEQDELFSSVQVEFLRTALSYPLERRPRKVDVNLILDTKKRVTRWQGEEARYQVEYKELVRAHEGRSSFAELQVSKVFPEEMEAYLLDLVYRKVISQQQYDLLLETEVYKRMSQKAWAVARGIAHATVRSWHFRAKGAIRKYVEARSVREQES